MRKTQKSKIVILSILGLAAVSIGSIGFATWLVGINKTSETLTIEAKVDNSQNDSIYLEATITNKEFIVAERAAYDKTTNGGIVGAKANSGEAFTVNANALKFTFSTFKLSVGKGVTDKDYPKKIVIDFDTTLEGNSVAMAETSKSLIGACKYQKYNVDKYEETAIGNSIRAVGDGNEKFSYITYHEELDITNTSIFNKTDKNTYWEYELNTKTREFSWGTFFGGTNPVAYYNNLYNTYNPKAGDNKNYMTGAQLFDFADKINTEITALNTALGASTTAKTLTINVSTSTQAISA